MEPLAPAAPAPSVQELIDQLGPNILSVMADENSDTADPDRVYILRVIYRNYLYFRDLEYFAPSFYAGFLDATNVVAGGSLDENANGSYDYTQNIFRGYCRKLEAVLGNRMPNVIAMPNSANDPDAIAAVESANHAAMYVRQKCSMQMQSLYLVFGLFNFGTMFWHVDWVIDEEKYGTKQIQTMTTSQQTLGNGSFNCPQCATGHDAEDGEAPQPPAQCQGCGAPMDQSSFQPPATVNVPQPNIESVPKGGLEISLHNGSEVSVPLDASCIDTCMWLDYSRESHKGKLLRKWEQPDGSNPLRDPKVNDTPGSEDTSASQYAENVRSAMGSPIGMVRPKRANYWTESDTWWTSDMYQMIDDRAKRQVLQQNFPKGLRISRVRGKIVDLKEEKLSEHWQECKPEPFERIMGDPFGNDWIQPQDLTNNMLNQRNETVERCNEPGFADPTRIDFDAYQSRRDLPGELFPALRPAGGTLADIIYRPAPTQFSDQIAPFTQEIQARAESVSGLQPDIWGGGEDEPTARQAELKKNAALMQLGVPWSMMGKSLEKVYLKACKLLAEFEDGVLAFSKKDQFQQYQSLAVVIDDLRSENYHFEADEAIPMTWGQMRDLMMWMLDKPAPLLEKWGFTDPLNIFEFKQLLGMPGERIPLLDNLKKGMQVIAQLGKDKAVPGPVDPQSGQPGPKQPSVMPDWEDDNGFSAELAKAYLQANPTLKRDNPDGYENIQLWGQANESKANEPPPPAPPKTSVAVSLKGPDLGDAAVQDAVEKLGLVDKGTPVAAVIPPPKITAGATMPAPGSAPPMPPLPPGQPTQ